MGRVQTAASRADARRNSDLILRVAVRLLATRPAATVDEVAAAAGVATRTVFRHFATREDLVRQAHTAALRDVATGLREALDGPPPDRRLDALVTAALARRSEYRLLSSLDHLTTHPEVRAELDTVLTLLESEAGRARTTHGLRSDVSDRWLARLLSAVVETCLEVPQDSPAADAELAVSTFLAAAGPRTGRNPDGPRSSGR